MLQNVSRRDGSGTLTKVDGVMGLGRKTRERKSYFHPICQGYPSGKFCFIPLLSENRFCTVPSRLNWFKGTYGPECGLSRREADVSWRRVCVLLSVDEVVYRRQLDPAE